VKLQKGVRNFNNLSGTLGSFLELREALRKFKKVFGYSESFVVFQELCLQHLTFSTSHSSSWSSPQQNKK
jgi:hypothetical protein